MKKANFTKLLNNIYIALAKAKPTKYKRRYKGKKGQWIYEYAKPGEKVQRTALEDKEKILKQQEDSNKNDIVCFAGACDRLRKKEGGEEFWQKMMATKKEIKESDFLKKVNIKDALDEDESWEEYKEMAKKEGDPVRLYESDNAFFFQTAGFEFIWKKDKKEKIKEFSQFIEIAKKYDSFEESFEEAKKIKNIPLEVSKNFQDIFGKNKTPKEAWKNFVETVRNQEKSENSKLSKATNLLITELNKAKTMPVGTVSRGRKKIAPGKWIPIEKEKGKKKLKNH